MVVLHTRRWLSNFSPNWKCFLKEVGHANGLQLHPKCNLMCHAHGRTINLKIWMGQEQQNILVPTLLLEMYKYRWNLLALSYQSLLWSNCPTVSCSLLDTIDDQAMLGRIYIPRVPTHHQEMFCAISGLKLIFPGQHHSLVDAFLIIIRTNNALLTFKGQLIAGSKVSWGFSRARYGLKMQFSTQAFSQFPAMWEINANR